MIRYKKLTTENYKSIGFAEVYFTPGIFTVKGVNKTGEYSSNGAGKSSILQAMTIALYNKDFQGAPLDSVSNRNTGKPFKVTLEMEVVRGGVSADYIVINDRATKKLVVRKNRVIHTSTTAKSLKFLQELLGMSESTFKFTHYITTNSILGLTENLSNATLFNEVLQVTELKTMSTDLLEVKKVIQRDIDTAQDQNSELNTLAKLADASNTYNLEDLEDQLEALMNEQTEIVQLFNDKVQPQNVKLKGLQESISNLKQELRDKSRSIEDGVCKLCSSVLTTKEVLTSLRKEVLQIEVKLEQKEQEEDTLAEKVRRLSLSHKLAKATIEDEMNKLKSDIIVAAELKGLSDATYDQDAHKKVQKEIKHLVSNIKYIDQMRTAISSGTIYEEVMNEFFSLVNQNIQRYKEVINFNTFDVKAASYRSGMVAVVTHKDDEIPVESLSNGEKARLSLLLLSALLESMSQVTNSESNFLVIDEATSSFDASGIKELSALFRHLKILNQSVFIITHGDELQDVEFDGSLTITKTDMSATAEFKKE